MATTTITWLLVLSSSLVITESFNVPKQQQHWPRLSLLSSSSPNKDDDSSGVLVEDYVDDETPAGIVGSKFFGGNKQKEEFYDPIAEAKAGSDIELSETEYDRFHDVAAFEENDGVSDIASQLQEQINGILYGTTTTSSSTISYASDLIWDTTLSKSSQTPFEELVKAKEFFRGVDVAIISGRRSSSTNVLELDWEISVAWPTFWLPRVLLVGTSTITMDANGSSIIITKQVDRLWDGKDMLSTVRSQILPRFWDMYHIGMTPAAELVPRSVIQKSFFGGDYQVFETPPRLVAMPTRLDTGGRENRNAHYIPNHAFSCAIKTMGPKKDVFVTTSPIQVGITPDDQQQLVLEWTLPLSVQFMTNPKLPIPGEDEEAESGSDPKFTYQFLPRRRFATMSFSGGPQDDDITEIRKKLYERVMKDKSFTPKMVDGRPKFTFFQNDVKTCYIRNGGLGMAVYEWRAEFIKSNEVGIELEM